MSHLCVKDSHLCSKAFVFLVFYYFYALRIHLRPNNLWLRHRLLDLRTVINA